ncbi:PREDICTED: putative F-box protein At3g17620 [Camelina sativa]|uniref:F-box protein At3g17620 n=1 Tax=Camelina sativa TaxID=90675 RepID=A0ABM0TTG0_CAMSA|nr:PREDICTED: putative F-box protein At3g17620 [Camelina sativa]
MINISNLPRDLVEESFSRVPLTSTRAVRSTCKRWNTLSKDEGFTRKYLVQAAATAAKEGEFLAIMFINLSLYVMNVNLHGIYTDSSDPFVKPVGKLISLNDSDQLQFIQICHCEGLVLCTTNDYTKLVVWNPYTGHKTRWICVEPNSVHLWWRGYFHALGYDNSKSCRAYKILRFTHTPGESPVHEIFEFKSNSWKVLDVTPDWCILSNGLTLKGNTYWFATNNKLREHVPNFLLCFDFTKERFGPRLHLPFPSIFDDHVNLSSLREEQLAVLYQRTDRCEMEVWITTMIEPDAVSWSKFLAVDMYPLIGVRFYPCGVVFDEDKDISRPCDIAIAYIIGENGYFRKVDLGEITTYIVGFPLACSYVPSSVQIDQPA